MKVALITDTHFGARGDNVVFLNYFNKFYYDFFFPYLEENGITEIFHLGDVVERRKYINFHTARGLRNFVKECDERDIRLRGIIGNHDAFYKNTNEINSISEMFSDSTLNIEFYSNPTEIQLGDLTVLALPWICNDNYKESMELIKNTKAQIAFGHLEVAGFAMYKGDTNVGRGWDRKVFDNFDMVLTGHYHHKSSDGQIYYLGSPYEMTWSDWNDDRGFHVFDTETRELTYVKNPYKIFHKLMYNDGCEYDPKQMEGSYLKVIVQNRSDDEEFDKFIETLESYNPSDLQVIEDTVSIGEDGEEFNAEVDDTLTFMKREVDNAEVEVDKVKLTENLESIYYEAVNVE